MSAGIAHLYFVTIHPFEDGNGRIARAITELKLAQSENSSHRFYSLSGQICSDRKAYYEILESTQRGSLDITFWLTWFLKSLENAIKNSDAILDKVLQKARFWEQHSRTPINDRQRKLINQLLEGFEGNLTSSKWAKLCKCSQDTAFRDIDDLIKKKILAKGASGGRSTCYILRQSNS